MRVGPDEVVQHGHDHKGQRYSGPPEQGQAGELYQHPGQADHARGYRTQQPQVALRVAPSPEGVADTGVRRSMSLAPKSSQYHAHKAIDTWFAQGPGT